MKVKLSSKIKILLTLLCAFFISLGAVVTLSAKPANATATGTLFDLGTDGNFSDEGLSKFMGKITGKEKASYNELKAYLDINQVKTGSEIDAQVSLGGQVWNVTYASETKGGDVIATLWLAESDDLQQWNNWAANASDWTYVSNMYSTSFIRSYITGSAYAHSASGGRITTDDVVLKKGTQATTWKNFVNSYGNYIASPSEVMWQESQDSISQEIETYNNLNEAYGVPTVQNWYDVHCDYTLRAGYSIWQYDKLWLPSLAETGYNADTTTTNKAGIWDLSPSARTGDGATSWLRSGYSYNFVHAYNIGNTGTKNGNDVTALLKVKPAFHLNLRTASAAAGLTVEAPDFVAGEGVTLTNGNTVATATYKENLTVNISIPEGVSVFVGATAVTGNSFKVPSAGTHVVTMTPKEGYSWSDGSLGAKTLTVVVEKATYDMSQVKWSGVTEFDCDGKVHRVELSGLPEGVTAIYSDNSGSAAGSYTATAIFIYDSVNYSAPNPVKSCGWTIKPAAAPVDPTDPTDPADPTDPTDPTDPADPTTPVVVQGGLSSGAIAGIVIAAVLAFVAVVTAIIAIIIKNKTTQVVYDGGFYDDADEA